MGLTINPKFAMYWSLLVVVLSFVGHVALPSYIPSDIGKNVAETATWITGLLAAIQVGFHGFSAPNAGPLVSKTDNSTL